MRNTHARFFEAERREGSNNLWGASSRQVSSREVIYASANFAGVAKIRDYPQFIFSDSGSYWALEMMVFVQIGNWKTWRTNLGESTRANNKLNLGKQSLEQDPPYHKKDGNLFLYPPPPTSLLYSPHSIRRYNWETDSNFLRLFH